MYGIFLQYTYCFTLTFSRRCYSPIYSTFFQLSFWSRFKCSLFQSSVMLAFLCSCSFILLKQLWRRRMKMENWAEDRERKWRMSKNQTPHRQPISKSFIQLAKKVFVSKSRVSLGNQSPIQIPLNTAVSQFTALTLGQRDRSKRRETRTHTHWQVTDRAFFFARSCTQTSAYALIL